MKRIGSVKQQGPRLARMNTAGTADVPGWGQGRPAGWKATRLRILQRDGGLCQCHECKAAGRYEIAHMVDHIDNRRGNGYDSDDNLAAINRQCHERKTQVEAQIARGLIQRPIWLDRFQNYGRG